MARTGDPPEEVTEAVEDMVQRVADYGAMAVTDCMHVSLSRTVVLQAHAHDAYVTTLRRALAGVRAPLVEFSDLDIVTNETGQRCFLVARVARGAKEVEQLTEMVDTVNVAFGLPTFYRQHHFHATLAAWPCDQFVARCLPREDLNELSTDTPASLPPVLCMVERQQQVQSLLRHDHSMDAVVIPYRAALLAHIVPIFKVYAFALLLAHWSLC